MVGHNKLGEVVVNIPKTDTDADGNFFLCFTPDQARGLANTLRAKAKLVEAELKKHETE